MIHVFNHAWATLITNYVPENPDRAVSFIAASCPPHTTTETTTESAVPLIINSNDHTSNGDNVPAVPHDWSLQIMTATRKVKATDETSNTPQSTSALDSFLWAASEYQQELVQLGQ
ncbi:hypothetical protein HDV05_002481, partial [Chytridiales sp. JEL 0842]